MSYQSKLDEECEREGLAIGRAKFFTIHKKSPGNATSRISTFAGKMPIKIKENPIDQVNFSGISEDIKKI